MAMGPDSTRLVVRFRPEAREEFQTRVVPHMRRQGITTTTLASLLALVTIGAVSVLLILEDGLMVCRTDW